MKKIVTVFVLTIVNSIVFGQQSVFPTAFQHLKSDFKEMSKNAMSVTDDNLQKVVKAKGYSDWAKFKAQNLAYNSNLTKKINIDYHEVIVEGNLEAFESTLLSQIKRVLKENGFRGYSGTENALFTENKQGAILSIDLKVFFGIGEHGSVMVIQSDEQSFSINTISTPKDGTHPVSGTRKFGWKKGILNGKKVYHFYTMGLDGVSTDKVDDMLDSKINSFKEGNKFWENIFEKSIKQISNGTNYKYYSAKPIYAWVAPQTLYQWITQ